MSYDEQIRTLLNLVKNGTLTNEPIPGMTSEQYFALIEDCERNGYISTYMKKIVYRFMGGDGDIADGIVLTKTGHDFLENKTETPTISQQFNFQSVSQSNIGNNGTVNIYQQVKMDELISYIKENINAPDQAEAQEVVSTLQSEGMKPGVLKKFDSLLEKYPGLTAAVSSVVMTILTGNTQ